MEEGCSFLYRTALLVSGYGNIKQKLAYHKPYILDERREENTLPLEIQEDIQKKKKQIISEWFTKRGENLIQQQQNKRS